MNWAGFRRFSGIVVRHSLVPETLSGNAGILPRGASGGKVRPRSHRRPDRMALWHGACSSRDAPTVGGLCALGAACGRAGPVTMCNARPRTAPAPSVTWRAAARPPGGGQRAPSGRTPRSRPATGCGNRSPASTGPEPFRVFFWSDGNRTGPIPTNRLRRSPKPGVPESRIGAHLHERVGDGAYYPTFAFRRFCSSRTDSIASARRC
jgi:hypothetical protein